MKPFECSENGVDRLGLFRIGKYPVFRRNVLWPVVILLEALRDCRHIPTGSEYAALVDTHIPVSYTHLDVYKRQPFSHSTIASMIKSIHQLLFWKRDNG